MSDSITRMTQTKMILEVLEVGDSITPQEALELCGCMRLAAIICELRKKGYPVETTMVAERNKLGGVSNFASYKMSKEWLKVNKKRRKRKKKA